MGNSNYARININVDGKIYPVQIDKNIILSKQNLDRKVFSSTSDGKMIEQYYPHNNYGHSIWSLASEIKFNESDFALFKNIADNYDEGESIITLSSEDFYEAIDKFRKGEFTDDISKNLPVDDFVKKEDQQRYDSESLFVASQKGELFLDMNYHSMKIEDEIASHILKSKNNSVNVSYSGDGVQSFNYIDKNGNKYSNP